MKDTCRSGAPADPTAAEVAAPGADCCASKEDEIALLSERAGMKRVLQIVLVINASMFLIEFAAGVVASSTALMADSVDMLGDASVYALSLYALNRGAAWRAGAALTKGSVILGFGVWIGIEVALKILHGVTPAAGLMAGFGMAALAANVTCLMLLWRYRNADVNMSSTFECSRNDVVSNLGVLLAAAGVWWTAAAWPDILIGSAVAAVFLRSAVRVLGRAWPEFRAAGPLGS